MTNREAFLCALFARFGVAVLVRADSETFRLIEPGPDWLDRVFPALQDRSQLIEAAHLSPFIENFLVDASQFWTLESDGEISSGPWTERDSTGQDVVLEASARTVGGERILLLKLASLDESPDGGLLLQAARNARLHHERLTSEILKKEILLNWIVHDLRQPLTGISAALSLLAMENLTPDQQQLVDVSVAQLSRIDVITQDLLRSFSVETPVPAADPTQPRVAPDALACATNALRRLAQAFAQATVRVRITADDDGVSNWAVEGDENQIEQMIWNLLANALRDSPPNSTVCVTLVEEKDAILLTVEDEGPVPSRAAIAHLFERVPISKEQSTDSLNLALYLSRLTCERLGGAIGFEPGETGPRFWIRLPKAA